MIEVHNLTKKEFRRLTSQKVKERLAYETKVRIITLMTQKNITPSKLAVESHKHRSVVSRLLNNNGSVDNDTLSSIAPVLGTSYMYLRYGFDDDTKSSDKVVNANINARIIECLEQNKKNNYGFTTRRGLAVHLQTKGFMISEQLFSECINGKKSFPQYYYIYIAFALNITYHELITGKKN